jgi:4-amino-4-deoxy-L-arabinose transferase-like glycosyltransferase
MRSSPSRQNILTNDLTLLAALAGARLLLHTLTNGQYGFHRDELAMLDEARFLAWGYVAYPPLTPFLARIALELSGPSLVGVRLFSALAQCGAMVLAGLMTRALGGTRFAQLVTAVATAIAPISLLQGAMFQYVSFDYLWWVLLAYLVVRLLKSEEPRWWLAIGAVIGLGMMTKYTLAYLVAGLVGGVALTQARRYLASRWLWGGVLLSLLLFLPNLLWQVNHDFISLAFLRSIHARDVAIGRADGFVIEQFLVATNPLTAPLWIAGLYYTLFSAGGKRYRLLGWMYLIPLVLFLITQGRSYYLAPAYPMLFAAGAVLWEQQLRDLPVARTRLGHSITWGILLIASLMSLALSLPVAPVNSALWNVTSQVHDNFVEQIGWQELVEIVAGIYAAQPPAEQPRLGILTGNYGEAGAINLYGRAHGLPEAISGVNSYWLRGYNEQPPERVIVVGYSREEAGRFFAACEFAGKITNRFGVSNQETTFHPDIFLCHTPRQPWPALWQALQRFG